jgi:cytokinesis protein
VQKSKEKNIAMEETRKRNEASMRRKHLNPALANVTTDPGPPSPSATGAMDSLLEKLRAAAPQARDQRDRRRRARLKDRHQVRIASGQKIPELPELRPDVEDFPVSLDNTATSSIPSPSSTGAESEDVADRAANMLQGLRSDAPEGDPDNSLRMRRRRESADDERRARRRRRGAEGSQTGQGTGGAEERGARTKSLQEETKEEEDQLPVPDAESEDKLSTPTTVVHPPSPDGAEKKTTASS